jgi:hypothetical protein
MGRVAYWDRAFGKRLAVAATANGFFAGDGSTTSVSLFANAGRLTAYYRTNESMRPVTIADIEEYRRVELSTASPPSRELEERRLAEMPYPKVFPAYRRFLADPRGRIWLERYPRPGDDTSPEWRVWDSGSMQELRLRMPSRFRALAILTGSVCGVQLDDNDVESIACYAVER